MIQFSYGFIARRRSTAYCLQVCRQSPSKKVVTDAVLRHFSSVDTPAADAEEAAKLKREASSAVKQQQQPVRPLFPWRHECIDNLLPRLTPGKPECDNLIPFPTIQHMCAFLFLNVRFIDAFITERWKSELSSSMEYAFFQGVAGIISNVYKVPFDEVSSTSSDDDVDKVDFCFPQTKGTADETDKQKDEGEKHESAPASSATKPDSSSDGNGDVVTATTTTTTKSSSDSEGSSENNDFCPQAKDMLDLPLRKLFESAHESGRDQLRIKLVMQPKEGVLHRTKFFRVYAVPFCSRIKLEQDPKFIKDLLNNGKPKYETVYELLTEHTNAQLNRDGRVQTTIAAEILVVCDEAFQVVDAVTGALLQGSADGKAREVVHIVTFAMTVSTTFSDTFPYLPHTRLGRWQMVDIDDALGAKKWYHVERV